MKYKAAKNKPHQDQMTRHYEAMAKAFNVTLKSNSEYPKFYTSFFDGDVLVEKPAKPGEVIYYV